MADQQKTIPVHNVPGVGTIHFPADWSEAQIHEALARLPEQQNMREGLSDRLYAGRDRTPAPTTLESLGRGAMDTVDRLSQVNFWIGEKLGIYPEGLGDAGTQVFNKEQQEYERSRRQGLANELNNPEQFDLARMVGGVGMTAPLALVPGGQTYLSSAGRGALMGGTEGALQYDPTNSAQGTASSAGVGAITGGGAAPLTRLATNIGKTVSINTLGRLKGLMERTKGAADPQDILREIPEFADVPVELRANLILEAQEQIKKTGELNVEQLARKANLVANDVTPTKSMVTRSPRDWSMERNMSKLAQSPDEQISALGQEMNSIYSANDKALAGRFEKMMAGLPKATQEAHGQAIMKTLNDLADSSQKDVGKLYQMVREKAGDNLASDARNLVGTLDDLADNTYAEKLVSSVRNKLKRFGMLDKDGNLTTKTLTVTQAEELRKFVNTLPNDFGRRDIIKAIDADVLQGAGSDAFEVARKAAQDRFAMLDNPVTQKALGAYGELTQGKTAQNFIKTQVVDAAEQDVNTLLQTLSKLPKEQADKAADALQAGILDHLQAKAVDVNSGKFSGAALNKEIQRIGEGKLQQILGSQGFKELKSLARAGLDATYEPPYAAVNHSNTTPTLLAATQRARGVIGIPFPGINEATERAAARAGYGKQLGQALAAKSDFPLPTIPPRVQALIDLINSSGAPVGAAAVNESRDKRRQ